MSDNIYFGFKQKIFSIKNFKDIEQLTDKIDPFLTSRPLDDVDKLTVPIDDLYVGWELIVRFIHGNCHIHLYYKVFRVEDKCESLICRYFEAINGVTRAPNSIVKLTDLEVIE